MVYLISCRKGLADTQSELNTNAKAVCKKIDGIGGKLKEMIDKQMSQIKYSVTDNCKIQNEVISKKIQTTDQLAMKLENMKRRLAGCPFDEVQVPRSLNLLR